MLRGLALALLGLSLLAGPAAARGDGSGAGRRAEAKVSRGAKAALPQSAFLLRRVVATTGFRPVAEPAAGPGACARAAVRGARAARCRGQLVGWGGWAQGLPPALRVQAQECPTGTMATLAEGHDDIVRCIPI